MVVVGKQLKPPKFLSTGKWINKLWLCTQWTLLSKGCCKGGFNSKHLFFTVLVSAKVPAPLGCWWRSSSLFTDCYLLLVSSSDGGEGGTRSLPPIKTLIPPWDSTLRTHLPPKCLPPTPITLGLQHNNFGGEGGGRQTQTFDLWELAIIKTE